MTTKLSDLIAVFSPEDRKDIEKRSRAHIKAMGDARRLDEIRRAVNKKQGEVALAVVAPNGEQACFNGPVG